MSQFLLDGHAGIAARAGADGAHLTGIEAFAAALALLKPDRIAGAGGLRSRHDAMLAGETGADYVMFGEPDRRERSRPPLRGNEERLTWWADCSKCPASVMRQARTRSGRWRGPAPTSSRWVTGYGRIRKARPRRSRRRPNISPQPAGR